MPRGDGTGPRGQGPNTGLGLGPCGGVVSIPPIGGRGLGRGRGRGRGLGLGLGTGGGQGQGQVAPAPKAPKK